MKNQTIHVSNKNISSFISAKPKPGGLRLGAIGTFSEDSAEYLFKISGGYETVVTECGNDMVVIECVSAALIRQTLGCHYAAEYIPVKLDCEEIYLHTKNNDVKRYSLDISSTENYGIASKMLTSDNLSNNDIYRQEYNINHDLKLKIMLAILGVTDIKEEHFISYLKIHNNTLAMYVAIIDCAASLTGYKHDLNYFIDGNSYYRTLKVEHYPVLLEVFKTFENIDIDKLLMPYMDIKTSTRCSMDRLADRIRKIIAHVGTLSLEIEARITSVNRLGQPHSFFRAENNRDLSANRIVESSLPVVFK